MKSTKKILIIGGGLSLLFFIYTACVLLVDRAPVGPLASEVGFASLNQAVLRALGESAFFYTLTELLGYAALAVAACFGVLGVVQLIRRKSLWRVDTELLLLGVFYAVVLACYVAFEVIVINYRPVIPEGVLEASYPSSHTMLTVCILSTAILQIRRRIQSPLWSRTAQILCAVIIVVTVVGRLLAGVHWLTDIIGGVLLSAALVVLYHAAVCFLEGKKKKE